MTPAPADPRPVPDGCHPACRACPHRTWTAGESLAQKAAFLARALAPWADVIEPVQSVAEGGRWGYRARAKLVASWSDGRWQFGLESRGAFIPIPRCPVHAPAVNAALALLAPILPAPADFPLRYVVFSGSLVTLIVKTARDTAADWLTDAARHALLTVGLRGMFIHRHPAAGRRLFAKKGWDCVFGERRVQDTGGLWHGPTAFQQLIPALADAALATARDFLRPSAQSAVADLYCGLGASARLWRSAGADVIGVELDGEALECAALNAPGAACLRGTCTTRLPQLSGWSGALDPAVPRLAYVNPPRMGIEPEVLAWLTEKFRPIRWACLSCSPGTLRRDLDRATADGYAVKRIVPFDFFPQTRHVETLALLERR